MTRALRWVLPLVAIGLTATSLGAERDDPTAVLEVTVMGFPDDRGLAHLALYMDRAAWDGEQAPHLTARLGIRDGRVSWRIDSLAPGDYAVRVFQDADGNGALDTGRRGVPKEPYGFSNDPPPQKGPARWEDAKFGVTAKPSRIEITLQVPPSRP